MVVHKLQRSTFWFFAITLLILMTDIISVRAFSLVEEDPVFVYAVMFDFMLVIPFLYWLFILRKKGKSIAKILPFPIVGALAVWLVLPAPMRSTVWNAVWPVELLIIVAEIAVIGYEIRTVYRVIKSFRSVSRQEPDTAEALRKAVRDGVGQGKLASLVLHDASLVYYLLFSWRKGKRVSDGTNLFSYHRKTNQVLYSAIITKIIIIEGIVVHLLLQQWSHWTAWILTIADLWLLALIWGDCRASVLQPIRIIGDSVRLRYGLRIQADIRLEDIADISSVREFHPDAKELKDAASSLVTPNIRIELKRPAKVNGLLFLPREVTRIYMALDEPEAFVQELRKRSVSQQ
ncbi:hypothetical protein [Cohnella silvisoli]|uniref:Uncharacterized protein n=1 Tax=Cohnella silvisoli TaxID=2873699 RepID=A0ABV1KTR4_9BACL|nr:hypothetical protein [Cohnella silvisoli]MCD9022554.1 hypothetical protein [Cohnella silvisoli]